MNEFDPPNLRVHDDVRCGKCRYFDTTMVDYTCTNPKNYTNKSSNDYGDSFGELSSVYVCDNWEKIE